MVLLTGAGGQVGTAILKALSARGISYGPGFIVQYNERRRLIGITSNGHKKRGARCLQPDGNNGSLTGVLYRFIAASWSAFIFFFRFGTFLQEKVDGPI